MNNKIGINEFVRRQTRESRFSHYEGSWESLAALVETHLDKAAPGYRDGVVLVPVPPEGFFSGVVEVREDTVLKASLVRRRPEEEPFVDIVAVGSGKLPARRVDIVLYRHDVLAAEGEASTDAEWEIISVNASPVDGEEPMHPVAMMRNMLGLPGGTAAEYTAQQLCEAIRYWSTRVMAG